MKWATRSHLRGIEGYPEHLAALDAYGRATAKAEGRPYSWKKPCDAVEAVWSVKTYGLALVVIELSHSIWNSDEDEF